MKSYIVLLFILLSGHVFSQDPMLQKPERSLNPEVQALTNAYNKELALTSKQVGLFEIKLEEFLIRREKIDATLKGKEKLETLYKLDVEETLEMQDILTHVQYEIYKQIKPQIQPLEQLN